MTERSQPHNSNDMSQSSLSWLQDIPLDSADDGSRDRYAEDDFTPSREQLGLTALQENTDLDNLQDTVDGRCANVQRTKLAHAVANILKRGYTLTNKDLSEIIPYYGYGEKSKPGSVVTSPYFKKYIESYGAKLKLVTHNRKIYYTDGNLAVSNTDLTDKLGTSQLLS